MGKEYATAFPLSTEIRGEEDDEVFEQLTVLFDNVANNRDIDNTIEQLDVLWQQSQSDTYNEYTTYAPYIGWNLANAYLLKYEKKEARMVLERMKADYSTDYMIYNMVDELLHKI